ncbi:unnamed protein product [Malus baccata var. baccata]
MESLSMILSFSPPPQNHVQTQRPLPSPPISLPQTTTTPAISTSQPPNTSHTQFPSTKNIPHTPIFLPKPTHFPHKLPKTQLTFLLAELIATTCIHSPFIDFRIRSLRTGYKFVLVIDAFRKLRDDPNAQLLDIRDEKSLGYLKSPNLKILNKCTVQVPFSEEEEAGFVKRVLERFGNPAKTVVCVLGNFDGISIKVAELLFKNGFKEAYAIKGGVGGTKGWLESQETLLPPSMHIYPKKKVKTSQETVTNSGVVRGKVESNGAATSTNLSAGESQTDNGRTTKATDSVSIVKNGSRSSSPYPIYQDLKPPSSPTPSKP